MQWATVNDLSTCYDLAGHGATTVVMLHEMGGSLESWDAVAPALSKHFRTLRYDQRGVGLSEKVRAPFGLEDLVDDLAQLLIAVQVALPCDLVGTAAGAAIALLFASRHPSWVRKLVLCCPAAEMHDRRRASLQKRAVLAENAGMRATLSLSLANSYPLAVRHDQAVYEIYEARFLAQDPTCYALMNRALMAVDTSHALKHIRCPTLVLAGEHDQVRPPSEVAAFAGRIPGARFALLNGGHLLSVQAPEALLATLNDFLVMSADEQAQALIQSEKEET